MELPQFPQADLTFHDVFEDEENKETPTVHHIRANSSIMQVKKILGESPAVYRLPAAPLASSASHVSLDYLANLVMPCRSCQPRRDS